MNYPELDQFKRFRQVIVWGFPLHSHTHSYIHGAWVKTFQYLGIPVHWFHDNDYPSPAQFDYTNTCFITEGWAENNIPVESSSTYFVHIAKDPSKYLDKGARLIDIRYHVIEINDFNYSYKLPINPVYISKDTLYEVVPDDRVVASKRGRAVRSQSYEAIYMHWATDLLPHEINEADAEMERERVIHYLGSVSHGHPFLEFKTYAEQAGIRVIHNDPWSSPVSYEENQRRMKESYCCPDFRSHGEPDKYAQYGKMNGTNHVDIGYIPCRVLKAISYGQMGITNSPRVKELLGEHVHYASRPSEVLPIVEMHRHDIESRRRAMRHIAEHHTYLQRVRDLARVLQMKDHRLTCVTALYDIGREKIDGRSIAEYRSWLEKTLQTIRDPMVLYLDPSLSWKNDLLEKRSGTGPIQIHEIPLTQLMMWKYKDRIDSILQNPDYIKRLKYPNDITNRLSEYCIIQYNKFEFLEKTISDDPFTTAHVCWMDAGLSRFYDTSHRYESTANIESLRQFAIQTSYADIPSIHADEYIGSNECILKGTLWVMDIGSFHAVYKDVMRIWNDMMMDQSRLDNEQIALALVYQQSPEVFQLHVSKEQIQPLFSRYFISRS